MTEAAAASVVRHSLDGQLIPHLCITDNTMQTTACIFISWACCAESVPALVLWVAQLAGGARQLLAQLPGAATVGQVETPQCLTSQPPEPLLQNPMSCQPAAWTRQLLPLFNCAALQLSQ